MTTVLKKVQLLLLLQFELNCVTWSGSENLLFSCCDVCAQSEMIKFAEGYSRGSRGLLRIYLRGSSNRPGWSVCSLW